MKLEYLHNGSADCPLIRLYEFTTGEVMKLKEIFDCLRWALQQISGSTGKLS